MIDDAQFSALRTAAAGWPVMVSTPAGQPAYWIVPFLAGSLACGFAQVELSGKVSRIGIFGSAHDDCASWIAESFFRQIPSEILMEIQDKFQGLTLSAPVLSYDVNPAKWAWRLTIKDNDRIVSTVFVTPGGWYEGR